MTMRVFHPPGPWAPGQAVTLDADESHYLLRVRRARVGTEVELLDGVSACWGAKVRQARARAVELELLEPRPTPSPMPLELLLVMPEPRAILESLTHASELGATAVWLVRGDHSPTPSPSAERMARTLRAAQRQCGRPSPPGIQGPTTLGEALAATAERPGHVASVRHRHRATGVRVDPQVGARLLVGPEGGLSAAELREAEEAGLAPLALGPWVLRTPTAVSAGLARLQGGGPAMG